METTLERVTKVVSRQLIVDESAVLPEASLVNDLEADSLDLVELVMAVEEEFGLEIEDAEAASIRTVGDIVDYVDDHIGEPGPGTR